MDKHMELYRIAAEFRGGIEQAKNSGAFVDDILFQHYPCACCGDASLLLGHHLLGKGINTYYVCGYYRQGGFGADQSHAWLMTEDGIILDITGDQFECKTQFYNYNIPVYVGEKDDFHNLFDVEECDVRISVPLDQIGCLDQNTLVTDKSVKSKALIKKHTIDFGGTLSDKAVMTLCQISRNPYYKYKQEIKTGG